ncbi:CGNR zinc finger domain-containing protein [Paenibacillus alvei]|uniref:CGNR zinc finger domain-containing protein n=1 Tax=Paenibacillus alvei TaxID=44250 RepID=UPI00227F4AEC|nr:CGNR zinc finger domain-containing protein [Paenibacillus alvei]
MKIPLTEHPRILYLRCSANSCPEIAALYGVHPATISNICVSYGLKGDPGRRKTENHQHNRALIERLLIGGASVSQLCERFDLSINVIHGIKEELGLAKIVPHLESLNRKKVTAILSDLKQHLPRNTDVYKLLAKRHNVSIHSIRKVDKLGLDAISSTNRISKALRQKLYHAINNGEKMTEISSKLNIPYQTVRYHKVRFEEKKASLYICAASDCSNTFVPRWDGKPREYCSDRCRDREKQRRYRNEHMVGRCPKCKGKWIEPENTHRGKPKYCRSCQEYYRLRYKEKKLNIGARNPTTH